jgi:hypothetical protein
LCNNVLGNLNRLFVQQHGMSLWIGENDEQWRTVQDLIEALASLSGDPITAIHDEVADSQSAARLIPTCI